MNTRHRFPAFRRHAGEFTIIVAIVACSVAGIVACDGDGGGAETSEFKVARSAQPRQKQPSVDDARFAQQIEANNALALALLKRLTKADEDGFIGPHSVSSALAMLQAAARGETKTEINDTLRFVLPDDALHASFNRLDLKLSKDAEASDVSFHSANALWAQKTLPLEPRYLDRLATSYDAGVNLLDFEADPKKCTEIINRWVADKTNQRIPDLLPDGAVNQTTLAVLTNAVYFKAQWKDTFARYGTKPAPFSTPKGSVDVPMMSGSLHTRYGSGDDYKAVALPYQGGRFSMLVVVPEAGKLDALRQRLDEKVLSGIVSELEDERVRLSLPRFELRSTYKLHETLPAMGMKLAFTDAADFSGLTSQPFVVTQVVHKTFLKVDEQGSEAAAATAIVGDAGTAAPPAETVSLTVDRPFLLFIRHVETGALLFAGQVVDPSAGGATR